MNVGGSIRALAPHVLLPANHAVSAFVDQPVTDLSRAQWGAFAQYLVSGSTAPTDGPTAIRGLNPLIEWATGMADGRYKPNRDLERYHDAWRIRTQPTDAVRAQLVEIMHGPASLSDNDWRTVLSVVDADPTGAWIAGPRHIAGEGRSLHDLAPGHVRTSLEWRKPIPWHEAARDEAVELYQARWRDALDPAYDQQLSESLLRIAGGTSTTEDVAIAAREADRIHHLARGMDRQQRIALADALLGIQELVASPRVAGPLQLLRSELDSFAVSPVYDAIAPAINDRIDRAVRMVERRVNRDDVARGGVVGHPDYADVGAATSLIDVVRDSAQPAATTATW